MPYDTDGRTLDAIRALFEIGNREADPHFQEARYLAAAASTDLVAYAVFVEKPAVLEALASMRGVDATPEALYEALTVELERVHSGPYGPTVRGLVEGIELLQVGPRTPDGVRLARRMVRRGSSGAHLARFFNVSSVRRAVSVLGTERQGLAALAALGADPCARGCGDSPLAQAPVEVRRAVGAVQGAYRAASDALAAGEADPFASLVRDLYEEALGALRHVTLPRSGVRPGVPETRVLVRLEPQGVRMTIRPLLGVIEGDLTDGTSDPEALEPETIPYAPRWSSRVSSHEPFVEAARTIRERARTMMEAVTGPEAPAWMGSPEQPPVAVVVQERLPGHLLARVILSLTEAGFDDLRLRREYEDGHWEIRLESALVTKVRPDQTAGRARVEIYGPFDPNRARRTFERHARSGRSASAELVLYSLIASRALYSALDALRATWPDTDPDVLLVLPHHVP